MTPARFPRAKTTRPRSVSVLRRERLYSWLEQCPEQQAIWVSGPAGSGKTTLASSYIEAKNIDCLWYQLDRGDSDAANFFYHLQESCEFLELAAGNALPALAPEHFQDISAYARRFFEDLFNSTNSPLALVLDNYQEVPSDSHLHKVVRACLEVAPAHVRIIVLSRTEPPPILAKARVDNALQLLGWSELRLRLEETSALAGMLWGASMSPDIVQILHQKTDGWIAGLILMLHHPEIKDFEPKDLKAFTPEEILDYFGSELFTKTAADIRRFLVATALLPEASPGLARELTGNQKAGRILEWLNREHVFTDKRSGEEASYAYHPLFREFLLSRAHRLFQGEELHALKARAAQLLEAKGQVEDAFSLYLDCGDGRSMVRIILARAPDMLSHSRQQTLLGWILRVPEEVRAATPWLTYWQGTCLLALHPFQARDLFEKALTIFQECHDVAGILLSLSGLINSIIFTFQPFSDLDPWIEKLDDASRMFSEQPLEIQGHVVVSMLNALVSRRPEHPEFALWKKRGRDMLHLDFPLDQKVQILLPLLMNALNKGDLAATRHYLNAYGPILEGKVTPLTESVFENLALYYSWLSGDFEQCDDHFQRVMDIGEQTGVRFMVPFSMAHMTVKALSTEDRVKARELIRQMEPMFDSVGRWARGLYFMARTWAALLDHDLSAADFFSREGLEDVLQAGAPHQYAASFLGRALTLWSREEREQSREALEQAFAWCTRLPAMQVEFACRLAQAEFAQDMNDQEAALNALQSGLKLGREQGYWNMPFWRAEVMSRLCAMALKHGIETDYVGKLIMRRNLFPVRSRSENWPWPLRVYTLGRFKILRWEKVLSFTGKVQKRPLKLLLALIVLGGDDVPETSLLDMLWPDLDGCDAHNAFNTTLHRLRKILGENDVLLLSAGKLTLNRTRVWTDVWAVEERLAQAESAWEEANAAKAVQETRRVLELYAGPLLPEVEESWGISVRERIRYRVLRCLRRLCGHHEDRQEWSDMEAACRHALQIDSLREDFHRGLMRCCLEQGRKAEALAVYQACKNRLATELGVEPDPKTRSLYHRIGGRP